jgi:hypothetical protein
VRAARWVAVGDSFTAGTGDDQQHGGWVAQTANTLARAGRVGGFRNLAVPGETFLFAGGEGFHDVTRDSTAIADRITMGAGPFAHCRRIPRTAAAAPSLRGRCLIGGLRGCAGSAGSTTRSQPPTGSCQLIEVGLAQVEFVAGGVVVHSNRRHGFGAITVKIAGKDDPCCLDHS